MSLSDCGGATGESGAYAQTLLDFIMKRHPQPGGTLSLADRQDGILTGRFARIMRPDCRPEMCISWPQFSLALLVSGLPVAGFGAGTDRAARLVTPAERIERINEITQIHGRQDAEEENDGHLREKVEVRGTLTTSIGKSLPDDLRWLIAHIKRRRSLIRYSVRIEDNTFSRVRLVCALALRVTRRFS